MKIKSYILKPIAWIIILSFIFQDIVWANPDIGNPSANTLQVPSRLQPFIDQESFNKTLLEFPIKTILQSTDINTFRYRLTPRLTGNLEGLQLDLDFSPPDEKANKKTGKVRREDGWVIPCVVLDPARGRSWQYEVFVRDDKSIELQTPEVQKPESAKKTDTGSLRFSLNDSRERINAAAAKLGYPGMGKGAIAEVNKALAKRKIFEPEVVWPLAAGVVFLLLSPLTAIKFLSVSLMVLGPLGIVAAVTITLIMRVIDRAHRKAKIGAAIARLLAGVDEAEVELGKGNIPPELSENIPLAIITKYEDEGAGNKEPLMGTSELVSLKNLIEKARAELKAFESGDSLGLNERQVYELLRRGRAGAPSVFDNIIRRVIFRTPYNGRESEVYKLFRALEVAETIARESDILASRYEDIGDERIKEIIEETKAKHRFSMEEMIKLNELLIKRGSSSYKYPLFSLWAFNIAVFFAPVFIFYIFAPYAITYVGIHGAAGGFIGMISGVFINWYASHPYASAIFLTASLIISIINWIFKDFYISPAGIFFNSEKVKLKDGTVTARRGVVNTPTAEMRDFILKSEGVRAVSGFLQTKRVEIERLCELTGNDIGSVDEAKLVDMILSENNIYRLGKGSNAPPRILVDELFNASEVDINFPIYTIALPAFGEPDVIKELIDSISNLIYPKDKLDIILLPEASDSFPRKGEKISTLERLHEKLISDPEKYSNITVLTSPIRVLDEHNQAKPYSTNYLLGITQGKYLVIYDAEDRPYPLQMVEALVGFENRPYYLERLIKYIFKETGSGKFDIRKIRAQDPDLYRKIIEYRFDAPVIADYVKDYRKLNPQILERQLVLDVSKAYIEYSKLGVLQAPLTWYNPVTLTSTQFILDYGTWFGIFLPGLEARELPVSHGGTSNHFLVKVLREVGGWDPHNVTEDAAIAIAIQRLGYRSLMLSSVTAEEAPTRQVTPKKWVWIGQHSRWGKGFVQTFLILLRNLFRHPIQMYRAFGARGIISNMFLFGVGTYSYIFTSLFVSTTFLWGISNLIVMGPVWAIAVMSFVVLLVSVMRGFSLIKTSVLSAGVVAANLLFWSVITSFAHYYLMMVPAALPIIPWLAGIVHAPAFLVGMVIMFAPMMTHIFYNLAAAWVGTPHRNFVITTTINEMRLRARAIKENDKGEAVVLEALADNLEKDPKFYRHLLYRAALFMTFTYRPFSILSFWLGYGQFLRGRPFWWDKTEHAGRGGAEDSGGVLGRVNGVLKAVRHRYIVSSINNKPVFLRFEWGALAFVILVAVFSFTSSIRYVRNKFMPDPGIKIKSSLYSSEQMSFMSRFGEGYDDYEGNVARGRAYYDKIISTYKYSPEYLKGRIKDMIRSYPKDGLVRSMEEETKICILAYMDITIDSIEDERQRERALEAFLEDLRISISQYGDRPIQKNSLERALDLAAGRSSDVPKNVPGWLWQCLEDTYDARTRMTFWGIYLLDRKPKWPLKFPEIPELPKSNVLKSGAGMIVVGSGLANINAVGSEWLNLAGLGLVFLGVIISSRKYIWKALVWIFTPSDIFVSPINTTEYYNDDARKLHELLQKTAEINRRIGLDKKPKTPGAVEQEFDRQHERILRNSGDRSAEKPALPRPVYHNVNYPIKLYREDVIVGNADMTDPETIKNRLERNIYYANAPPERKAQIVKRLKEFAPAVPFLSEYMRTRHPELEVINISIYGSYPFGDEISSPSDADIMVMVRGNYFSSGEMLDIRNDPAFAGLSRSFSQVSIYIMGAENLQEGKIDGRNGSTEEEAEKWRKRQKSVCENTASVLYRRNFVLDGHDFASNDNLYRSGLSARAYDLLFNSYRRIFLYHLATKETEYERFRIATTRIYDAAVFLKELSHDTTLNVENIFALRRRFERMYPVNPTAAKEEVIAIWTAVRDEHERILSAGAEEAFRRQQDSIFRNGGDGPESAESYPSAMEELIKRLSGPDKQTETADLASRTTIYDFMTHEGLGVRRPEDVASYNYVNGNIREGSMVVIREGCLAVVELKDNESIFTPGLVGCSAVIVHGKNSLGKDIYALAHMLPVVISEEGRAIAAILKKHFTGPVEIYIDGFRGDESQLIRFLKSLELEFASVGAKPVFDPDINIWRENGEIDDLIVSISGFKALRLGANQEKSWRMMGLPERLKIGKLDLPVRSREDPALNSLKVAGVQLPENDFLENTGIMKDVIVGMSGWGVYKPDIVLFPESMDHIDSLRFDPADRLNAIQSVVDVTGIAAGYFIENDRPENKSLDINMTYTVLRPGVSPLIFRKFKEDEENRIFYVNGKKMALLICIESEGAISEPAYRMPELSFKDADAIIVVAGTDKQEAIVWPRDLSRKYRKPVVFVNFGGDKGLLRPQSSFFFAVEGSVNSNVELSEDSILYADIRQNEPGLAENILVPIVDDEARAQAYDADQEYNASGEEGLAKAISGRPDILNETETVSADDVESPKLLPAEAMPSGVLNDKNTDGVMVADRTHFRNIKDPKQMANNMIEAAMSILLSHKKLVLAFHKDLFKSGRVQVLLRKLAKLKEDPQFGKLLQGLEIIQSCEDLPGELARRDIDASDERNVIFMFAGGDAIAEMQRVSPLVKTVLIDDGKDFEPALYYYPLFEIVAITLLKYHQRYSKEDVGAVFTKFGMTREEFNIKDFSDDDPRASLVFTLLPRAERLNTAIGPERYGLVLSFIASAA